MKFEPNEDSGYVYLKNSPAAWHVRDLCVNQVLEPTDATITHVIIAREMYRR